MWGSDRGFRADGLQLPCSAVRFRLCHSLEVCVCRSNSVQLRDCGLIAFRAQDREVLQEARAPQVCCGAIIINIRSSVPIRFISPPGSARLQPGASYIPGSSQYMRHAPGWSLALPGRSRAYASKYLPTIALSLCFVSSGTASGRVRRACFKAEPHLQVRAFPARLRTARRIMCWALTAFLFK